MSYMNDNYSPEDKEHQPDSKNHYRDIMWKTCIFLSHVRDERLTYPELAAYRLTGE